ncbi:MAG: hypothetical protein KC478_06250 [Bacteriovoracaceae bacterium]|nr:hypothetical protein [Bacteriovoracaceae bacterium]
MKLITVLFFIPLMALAHDSCIERVDTLCDSTEDFYKDFRLAKNIAFKTASKKAELRNLICQNFIKGDDGVLIPDFSWGRNCWFYGYKNLLKNNKIKNCSDFKSVGADSYFLSNCEDLINLQMQSPETDKAHSRAEEEIEDVKNSFREALKDEVSDFKLKSLLSAILPETSSSIGLSSLKTSFIRAKDLCEKHPTEKLCRLFKYSDRYVLILGGNLFLKPKALRALISKKIAEFIAQKLHDSLYEDRLGVYFELFSESSQRDFESIVARSMTFDPLNKNTNTTLVLSKLYENEDELEKCELSFYCQEEASQAETEFDKLIYRLKVQDKMRVLACPVERVIGL